MKTRVGELDALYQNASIPMMDLGPGEKKQHRTSRAKAVGRHVKWAHAHLYEQVRAGIPIASQEALKQLVEQKAVTEAHFFIFRHRTRLVSRSSRMPRYEAVYWCQQDQTWLLVQKGHMRIAYRAALRSKRALAWTMIDEHLPYWVDRYAFSAEKKRG